MPRKSKNTPESAARKRRSSGSTQPTTSPSIPVVTCFVVRSDGKLLALRRSDRVGTYRGKWAGVSGYLERESPRDQAWIELREELGLDEGALELEVEGEPLTISDQVEGKTWLVHPFRFRLTGDPVLRLDWEHLEMKWILPREIRSLATVPNLLETWNCVAR